MPDVFDPANDVWVWLAVGLLLALLGARAWTVETGHARLGRTPATVRALTGSAVAVFAVLVGLLAMQGGSLLVSSIVTKTDPANAYTDYQSDLEQAKREQADDDQQPDPGAPGAAPPGVGAPAPVSGG